MSDLTPRAYLVSLGLAKEGRGRFSADAVKALDEAKAKGIKFAEPVKAAAKPKAPKPAKPATAAATPTENGADKAAAALARREAKQAEIEADRKKGLRAPSPLDMPKRRPENSGYITENGVLFRFDRCRAVGCGQAVNRCACAGGPKAPTYRGTGIQGQALTLDKPASL